MKENPIILHIELGNQSVYDWLKEKDKLGGQNKIPRLSNERTYLEQLLRMQYVEQV